MRKKVNLEKQEKCYVAQIAGFGIEIDCIEKNRNVEKM
jgi:hypothetical protein